MKLLHKLRRASSKPEEQPPDAEDYSRRTPPLDDPLLADETLSDHNADETSAARSGLIGRIRHRLPKPRLPGRGRKAAQEDDEDPDNPSAQSLLGDDAPLTADGPDGAGTLHEMLASDLGDAGTGKLADGYNNLADEDPPQKEQAQAITFDTRPSSILEPIARYLIVAGLVSFCVLTLTGATYIYQWVKSDDQASTETAAAVGGTGEATAPSQRAADLGEEFARSYLAYPAAEDEGSGDYLEAIEPYLHPSADTSLFIPVLADDAPGTDVSYASARSVEAAPGEDRYRVTVDARLKPADAEDGGDQTTSRVLTAHVQVPPAGGAAYVVAPPTVTEGSGGSGSGQPGLYGYSDAQALEEPKLESTLSDFFEALYGPEEDRPLVEEEMVEGARVESYPPAGHSYEGIERAAVYYRESPEEVEAAESRGFEALYDIEVYAGVTDEDSGANRLDSWALTVGEDEEGDYKITAIH